MREHAVSVAAAESRLVKDGPLKLTDCDMVELAKRALRMLEVGNPAKAPPVEVLPMPAARGNQTLVVELFMRLFKLTFNATKRVYAPVVYCGALLDVPGVRAVYFVQDNGQGMAPEEARYHFELGGLSDTLVGEPSDLAVACLVVERHKGRLWVETVPGEGSTYFFTLAD